MRILEKEQRRGTLQSPKLQGWSLTIRLFSVIFRATVWGVLPPSAEMKSVYSTAPADWAGFSLFSFLFFLIVYCSSNFCVCLRWRKVSGWQAPMRLMQGFIVVVVYCSYYWEILRFVHWLLFFLPLVIFFRLFCGGMFSWTSRNSRVSRDKVFEVYYRIIFGNYKFEGPSSYSRCL